MIIYLNTFSLCGLWWVAVSAKDLNSQKIIHLYEKKIHQTRKLQSSHLKGA